MRSLKAKPGDERGGDLLWPLDAKRQRAKGSALSVDSLK